MGNKGSQKFSGAKGAGPELDFSRLSGVIATLDDQALAEKMEDEGLLEIQERAREISPDALRWLEDVGADRESSPSARVSAAREVLHQAVGRPATQRVSQEDQGSQITVNIQEYRVEGPPVVEEKTIEVEPVEKNQAGELVLEVDEF